MKIIFNKVNRSNDVIEIHDHDTWNLDITFARVIAPCLRKLRDDKLGVPGEVCVYDDNEQLLEDESLQRWIDILNDMIYTFETIAEQQHLLNEDEVDNTRIQRGLQYFAQYYLALWT